MTHEIAHALGFFHEQARYDRDDFVQINASAIERGAEENFNRQTEATNNNHGVEYDYGSVMHYSDSTFCRCIIAVAVASLRGRRSHKVQIF